MNTPTPEQVHAAMAFAECKITSSHRSHLCAASAPQERLKDSAACTGLRWVQTNLNGQPQRLHSRDCPQMEQCARYHHGDWLMAAGETGVWVEEPQHGADCPHFVQHAEEGRA